MLRKILFLSIAAGLLLSISPAESFSQQTGIKRNYTEMYKMLKSAGIPNDEINAILREMNLYRPAGFIPPVLSTAEIDSLNQQYSWFRANAFRKALGITQVDTISTEELIAFYKAKLDSLEVVKPYGYEYFKNINPELLRVPTYGTVSSDFLLGPRDEIIIDLWGTKVERLIKTISLDGSIYMEDMGPVTVAGMTLYDVEEKLKRDLGAVYSGLKTGEIRLKVTLSRIRNIVVSVVGEVHINGPQQLSALAGPLTALNWALGPTDNGSLRNIKIIRGSNKLSEIDLYQLWMEEEALPEIRLQDNDVIQVPLVMKRVTVKGEVRRQRIYEMKEGETLKDALRFAGGFTSNAWRKKIQIERFIQPEIAVEYPGDVIVIDVNLQQTPLDSVNLADGDVVTVFPLTSVKKNYVRIGGSVNQSGTYMYRPGMTLGDLIDEAGGLQHVAFLERGNIERTMPDSSRQMKYFTLLEDNNAMPGRELPLKNLDEVKIYSQKEFEPAQYIQVLGDVKYAGYQEYLQGMTVKDAILKGGGFLETALHSFVEVSRIIYDDISDSGRIETTVLDLSEEYAPQTEDFVLQNRDIVFVRKNPEWKLQETVKIDGEINIPGDYPLRSENETLIDLINRAGGIKENVNLDAVYFHRKKDRIGRIGIDLREAMKKPESVSNIKLAAGDSVYIPELENLVKVLGEVNLPQSVLFKQGSGLEKYITGAGGLKELADKGRIQIILANGTVTKPRRFWFDPEITPGSTIIVPRRTELEGIDWGQTIAQTTQIVSALVTTIYILNSIK